MDLLPQFTTPSAPHLPVWDLPSGEQGAGRALQTNLSAMTRYATEFTNTVGLFAQVAQSMEQHSGATVFMDWMMIVGRAGVVSLYNYRMAMDGAMNVRRQLPTWRPHIDHKEMEHARERFRKDFPHTKELRQSIMHTAELFDSDEKYQKNRFRHPVSIPSLMNVPAGTAITHAAMMDSTYFGPFEGNIYSYELSRESVLKIKGSTEWFFNGFAKLADMSFSGRSTAGG
jgi:hypothetical protein